MLLKFSTVLKGPSFGFKVRLLFLFTFSLLLFRFESLFCLILLLTRLWSSSSDDGVKNFANSFTLEDPMRFRGSSLMFCNPVSESLLFLRRAEAFSACTCFIDPLSHGTSSGFGGRWHACCWRRETGLGLVLRLHGNLLQTVIRCCCSLRSPICLLITACPCFSLVPASRGKPYATTERQCKLTGPRSTVPYFALLKGIST